LDTLDEGQYPQTDVTVLRNLFLAIIVQMGDDVRDTLEDYRWTQ
jgi:hypothetical protein